MQFRHWPLIQFWKVRTEDLEGALPVALWWDSSSFLNYTYSLFYFSRVLSYPCLRRRGKLCLEGGNVLILRVLCVWTFFYPLLFLEEWICDDVKKRFWDLGGSWRSKTSVIQKTDFFKFTTINICPIIHWIWLKLGTGAVGCSVTLLEFMLRSEKDKPEKNCFAYLFWLFI